MLLTPRQVADRLNVSPRTVYAWIEDGRLPAVRLSERVTRVPEEAVDALVAAALDAGSVAAEARAAFAGATAAFRSTLAENREEILRLAHARHASNVRVFGSVARGDARAGSDIDILVDLDDDASLLDLAAMQSEIEALLGRRVDVVPSEGLKPGIRERVLSEAVPL